MEGSAAETVKAKLGVAEVVKSYIELIPAGRNFKARCPFHHEKTPSFIVSPDRGTWHCFGCNQGGDIFTFVMKYENLEFGEALKILAERAGVELRKISPLEYKHFGLLYDLNAAAKDFFKKQLAEAPTVIAYLKGRGLTEATIEEFEIGFAPNATDALARYLIHFGYAPDDVLRAGLAGKSDRGLIFDRFRGRVMFPIANHAGKTVAFTGRILPELDTGEIAKYLNSPETAIFQKSRILYNFSRAKAGIREKDQAFMVEGQMDAVMCFQSGVKNVVATSGTALTNDHLAALRRLTDKLVLSFDSDEAGLAALERAIDLAERMDFGVMVAVAKGAKDPADIAAADPAAIQKMIDAADPAPRFYFDRYLDPKGDPRDRAYLMKIRKVASKIHMMASAVQRSLWMKELAERTRLSETALQEEALRAAEESRTLSVPKPSLSEGGPTAKDVKPRALSRPEMLTEALLGAALAKNDFTMVEDVVSYLPLIYRPVLDVLKSGNTRDTDSRLDELLNHITLTSEEMSPAAILHIKDQLRKEYIRARRQELAATVRNAELGGDEAALKDALRELSELPVI